MLFGCHAGFVFLSWLCFSRRLLNRLGGNVEIARGHDLLFGVVEMLGWILDTERRRIGVVQRIPDHVEPVAVAELHGAIPFVYRELDRRALLPPIDLYPADAPHRITVAGLRIGGAVAADVEADLQVADPFAFPAA